MNGGTRLFQQRNRENKLWEAGEQSTDGRDGNRSWRQMDDHKWSFVVWIEASGWESGLKKVKMQRAHN